MGHQYLSYTNGRAFNDSDRWLRTSEGGRPYEGSAGYRPVLVSTFKVHPLEALDVRRYTGKNLMQELVDGQKEDSMQQDKEQQK